MDRLRALREAVVAAAVCAGACGGDGPAEVDAGLSEYQFLAEIEQYRGCWLHDDCISTLSPCSRCPIGINASREQEVAVVAGHVQCTSGPADCEPKPYAICSLRNRCLAWPEPPPPDPRWYCEGCNAVAGTGCDAGKKCTILPNDEELPYGCPDCAPAGAVAEGGACTFNELGVDDCQPRLFCVRGACRQICGLRDNVLCDSAETCAEVPVHVEDFEYTGICLPACDPVASPAGCVDGESCYLDPRLGRSHCAPPFTDYPEASQGAPTCAAAPGTQGCQCRYSSGCAAGHMCASEPCAGNTCAFVCDASGSGGPTCDDGPGPGYRCVPVNAQCADATSVADAIGMCVPLTQAGGA